MKKNGFTLIELLATLVLLSIVLLIAVPIIINIYNNIKNQTILINVEKLIDSTETYLKNYELENGIVIKNTQIEIKDGKIENNPLDIRGNLPQSGTIYINSDSEIAIIAYDNGKCLFKDYNDNEAKFVDLDQNNCTYIEANRKNNS